MENMSKTSGDVSEVVFDQPEEKAGAMDPDGSVPNRRKEKEWLEATEPYHGARPRTTEFDRTVDEGLGATLGGKEENGSEVAAGTANSARGGGTDATTKGTTQERGSPTEETSCYDG